MRYFLILSMLSVFFVACRQSVKGTNGEVYKSPIEYNDYIVERQSRVMQHIMDFLKIADSNLDSARAMLVDYSMDVDKIVFEIKGMPPYKGDSALRDAAVQTFSFYRRIFQSEYKQIIDIRMNGGNETAGGIGQMNEIVEKITAEEEKYDKVFHNAQRDFAQKNDMKLIENEMQKKFEKAVQ